MKLTPSSILAHPRANWCCDFPVRSKKEAIRESVPITIVLSRIKGVENPSERTRLIVSPTIPPAFPALDPAQYDRDGNAFPDRFLLRPHGEFATPVGARVGQDAARGQLYARAGVRG